MPGKTNIKTKRVYGFFTKAEQAMIEKARINLSYFNEKSISTQQFVHDAVMDKVQEVNTAESESDLMELIQT